MCYWFFKRWKWCFLWFGVSRIQISSWGFVDSIWKVSEWPPAPSGPPSGLDALSLVIRPPHTRCGLLFTGAARTRVAAGHRHRDQCGWSGDLPPRLSDLHRAAPSPGTPASSCTASGSERAATSDSPTGSASTGWPHAALETDALHIHPGGGDELRDTGCTGLQAMHRHPYQADSIGCRAWQRQLTARHKVNSENLLKITKPTLLFSKMLPL